MDIKAPGINHSKLKVCVMQSPMKCGGVAVINFPSESAASTRRTWNNPSVARVRVIPALPGFAAAGYSSRAAFRGV